MKKIVINNHKNSHGFSIIELLVVLPLLIILSFFLAYLVSSQYWSYNNQSIELNITNDARQALDDTDNYVRQAYRVATSYSTYNTGAQTLVLQLQSIDSSSQIIAGNYDYVVYYLSGTDFYRQVFADASSSRASITRRLASNIDTANFSFTYDNASYSLVKQVTTNMALKQNMGGQIRSIAVSSEAKLRNY